MRETIADHWTRVSPAYNKRNQQSISKKFEKEGWQSIFTEAIGKERRKILDVGTGPGVVAIQLAELGHDVTGVDMAEGMLKEARANADRFGSNAKFEKGDAENLPFEDNTFDMVVNRWVLWTLGNPDKALNEWHRVLKPGGKLVYIDGNWYTDLKNSWWRRRWCSFAKALMAISDHKNPFKGKQDFDDDTWQKLWSTHADRPSIDVKMMEKSGFKDIYTKDGLKRRVLRGMRLVKRGYWRDYFLVSGTKDA